MIHILKSNSRGTSNHGWLDSKHSFSFANFYNPNQMGFRVLRVINEDRILGGTGFDTHPHRDMEIISYVIDGALEHKDSMGNVTIINPGEVQRMSAGTGVSHSEYNHEKDKVSHFLQIWILPEKKDILPSYDQKNFSSELAQGDVVLVASKEGKNGSITLNQDVYIYACKTRKAGEKSIETVQSRHFWVQLIKGELEVMNEKLTAGDGMAISEILVLKLKWQSGSEFIIFDLP